MPDETAMPCGVAVFRIVHPLLPKVSVMEVPKILLPERSRIVRKRSCAENVQVVGVPLACTIKVEFQSPPNVNCGKMYLC